MDLRDKPGKVQKLLELSCRFRLISLVLAVVFSVTFVATLWPQMSAMPLGASEALGMWMANFGTESLAGAEYLGVAALAMFVMAFVFGGVRSGIGAVAASVPLVTVTTSYPFFSKKSRWARSSSISSSAQRNSPLVIVR